MEKQYIYIYFGSKGKNLSGTGHSYSKKMTRGIVAVYRFLLCIDDLCCKKRNVSNKEEEGQCFGAMQIFAFLKLILHSEKKSTLEDFHHCLGNRY